MQRYLIQRILLVIPTLWLVVSLLFLALRALPGDFVTRKLSNLENQGAEQRESEIVGFIEVEETTHRVISGDTLESIAADNNTTISELLTLNPDLDTSGELRPRRPGRAHSGSVVVQHCARRKGSPCLKKRTSGSSS